MIFGGKCYDGKTWVSPQTAQLYFDQVFFYVILLMALKKVFDVSCKTVINYIVYFQAADVDEKKKQS